MNTEHLIFLVFSDRGFKIKVLDKMPKHLYFGSNGTWRYRNSAPHQIGEMRAEALNCQEGVIGVYDVRNIEHLDALSQHSGLASLHLSARALCFVLLSA